MFWMEILLDALHKLNIARQDGVGTIQRNSLYGSPTCPVPLPGPGCISILSRLVAFLGKLIKSNCNYF